MRKDEGRGRRKQQAGRREASGWVYSFLQRYLLSNGCLL